MYNNKEYIPKFITATTATQIFTGKGVLRGVVVGTTAATAVVFYDAVGAGTGTIALLKASIVEGTYTFDATVANGLYMTAASTGTYTITYTK